jgi:Carboxylesterase family
MFKPNVSDTDCLNLVFQRAKPRSWVGTWDATYFRPACPQNLSVLQQDIPEFQKMNISEDCLYMNIFVPNVSELQIILFNNQHLIIPCFDDVLIIHCDSVINYFIEFYMISYSSSKLLESVCCRHSRCAFLTLAV